jgi:hypothetical protein
MDVTTCSRYKFTDVSEEHTAFNLEEGNGMVSLLVLLFDPDDGGDIFFRNFG